MTKSLRRTVAWSGCVIALVLGLVLFFAGTGEFLDLSGTPDILPVITAIEVGRETGLPIPRFVSLASSRVRMRVGPGFKYDIAWVYVKEALPMEIIAEFGNWRKVRDYQGSVGWMHQSLLTGVRTALVEPWNDALRPLRSAPKVAAPIVAWMEPGLLVSLSGCDRTWCNVAVPEPSFSGYIPRKSLWGVYNEPSLPIDDLT